MIAGNRHLPLLIVEDSDEDFDVMKLTLDSFGIKNPILRCAEGGAVLKLLEKRSADREVLPGLILLDLNLIGVDGREVLRRLKAHPLFKRIPVLILSTSSSPKDVDSCYAEGAACYTVKPVSLEKLEHFVRNLREFWLESAILPRPMPIEELRKPNA